MYVETVSIKGTGVDYVVRAPLSGYKLISAMNASWNDSMVKIIGVSLQGTQYIIHFNTNLANTKTLQTTLLWVQ